MYELRKALYCDFDFYYMLKCEDEAVYWGGWKSKPLRSKLLEVYEKLINCPPHKNYLDVVCGDCGQVGYIQYSYRADSVELSIGIMQKYCGRGIASKAIRLACRGFNGKIIAYIREDNIASQRAFQKCGFVKKESSELRYIENLNKYIYMELWIFEK